MPTVTVRDVLRLALPVGTRVVAGDNALQRQVTWIATLRATPPAFAELRGGELALLSVEAARLLDPWLTLANLVRRLGQAPVPVAGVVALGAVEPEDARAAEEVRLPLLQLPENSDLREIEREISRLIGDFEAQLDRRGAQLYNLLTQESLSGRGVPGLLDVLAEQTGQGVACYAVNGELRVQRARGSARIALQALRPDIAGETNLLSQQIWVEPVGHAEYPAGYLAIAGTTLDEWDRAATARGAAALALEFAKEQAVVAAEERLRGDFVSSILAGGAGDQATIVRRGGELGYDLTVPHTALLVKPDDSGTIMLTRLINSIQNELNRRAVAAPLSNRNGAVLCMVPLEKSSLRARDLADLLRERLSGDYPGLVLALGSPAATISEWRRTLEEAEQALLLGRQLFGPNQVVAFSDLGVYRLLVRLRETAELWAFHNETLSALSEYDRRQDGELIKTLEAYFNHLGNLRATSQALHVHRNTLLYRLERIKQISGLDLDNAEEYFALWLALRAHRVLRTLDENV